MTDSVVTPPSNGGSGIHWMPLIFIALLFTWPLIELIALYSWEANHAMFFYSPSDSRLMGLDNTVTLAISFWASWVGVQMFRKREGCLRKLKAVLVASFVLQCLKLILAASLVGVDEALTPRTVRFLLAVAICFVYFRRSKVVAQLYGTNI